MMFVPLPPHHLLQRPLPPLHTRLPPMERRSPKRSR
jgi:hypothetical protein